MTTFLMPAMLMALPGPPPVLGPQEEIKPAAFHVHLTVKCNRRCRMRRAVRPYNAKLEQMAQCESSGRWHINTGNGYYGGLQFDLSTWRSVGGRGYPHQASKLEQKYRAVKLIHRRGYAPWPVCG